MAGPTASNLDRTLDDAADLRTDAEAHVLREVRTALPRRQVTRSAA